MRKFIASVLAVLLIMSATGCGWFKKDPQKAVNEGVLEFTEVEKMQSKLVMTGAIQAPEGEIPQRMQFSIEASGQSDTSGEQPKIDMTMKGSLNTDGNTGSGELAFKIVDKKAFVNLMKLEFPGEANKMVAEQLGSVLGAWWEIPTSEQNPLGKYAEEQEKIREKLKTLQLFTNAVEDAEEEVQGISCTRYRVDLNKEAVKEFLLDLAVSAGNELTPEEEIAIGESLNDVEFSGAVWIGDDDILHRIHATFTAQPVQGPSTSFEIDYTAWAYDEDVAIEAPASAREFNPLMLLPLIGTFGSVGQGAASADTGADAGANLPAAAEGESIDQPLGAAQVEE